MKVQSLMRQHHTLVPVEIELSLTPGLPQMIVLGLPDAMIKESMLRIRSALKHQGFAWPKAQQILVHLKPSHLKKSSLGLDLAIAAALLWETKQIPQRHGNVILYGELSLKGEVLTPLDVTRAAPLLTDSTIFMTGREVGLTFHSLQLRELKDLENPRLVASQEGLPEWKRPQGFYQDFSKDQADLMTLIAAGEHNALIAGPPGCGKTSLAEEIAPLIDEPSSESWSEQVMWAQNFQQPLSWRPVVQAHHSIPPLSMLGGGAALKPGEITRANGGVLIMDEMLEYSPRVQEALREPVESGVISLARAGNVTTYPADFLLIGTTNLCPCGDFNFNEESKCRCRALRRDNHLARLNGPFMDRFAIFKIITQAQPGEERVSRAQIANRVSRAIKFRKESRSQKKPNAKLTLDEIAKNFESPLLPRSGSQRRTLSVLRVARTLADLEAAKDIGQKHFERARHWAQRDFECVQSYKPTTSFALTRNRLKNENVIR